MGVEAQCTATLLPCGSVVILSPFEPPDVQAAAGAQQHGSDGAAAVDLVPEGVHLLLAGFGVHHCGAHNHLKVCRDIIVIDGIQWQLDGPPLVPPGLKLKVDVTDADPHVPRYKLGGRRLAAGQRSQQKVDRLCRCVGPAHRLGGVRGQLEAVARQHRALAAQAAAGQAVHLPVGVIASWATAGGYGGSSGGSGGARVPERGTGCCIPCCVPREFRRPGGP
eukprot:CAMPEP_0117676846 /NCGR_PEP_ID=MMETSP0804-20121206/16424_1 /TAXON_ID=1074897 /ORGANISM="Tetraselmis astigmatica, Strain CCMP880" /LENGTH=220 /DNA_ID=CAMNT_0005486079 /DNA_START=945 /DNA_END=1608 /DNA_ORIENTATION=+